MEKEIEIIFKLNDGEVIPEYPKNLNIKDKIKQVQTFYVNGQIKKIAYSEQSIAGSLSAYKNGQKMAMEVLEQRKCLKKCKKH